MDGSYYPQPTNALTTPAMPSHTHANRDVPERSAVDPTDSKRLRERFKKDFNARLRTIKGHIHATVIENDAFRLKDREPGEDITQEDLPPSLAEYLYGNEEPAPGSLPPVINDIRITSTRPDDLRAVEDSARLDQLDAWLEYVYEQELIGAMDIEDVRAGEHWSAEYLNEAYVKGDRLAVTDLKEAGFDVEQEDPSDILFDAQHSPVLHQEYTETYRDMEYLSNDLRRDAHRNAAALLAGGVALSTFADGIRQPAVTDGGNRMGQIADVRIVETINEGALERYARTDGAEELGYTIERPDGGEDYAGARWETAGDHKVCAECRRLHDQWFSIDQLRKGRAPKPPIHPHCRCVIHYRRRRTNN